MTVYACVHSATGGVSDVIRGLSQLAVDGFPVIAPHQTASHAFLLYAEEGSHDMRWRFDGEPPTARWRPVVGRLQWPTAAWRIEDDTKAARVLGAARRMDGVAYSFPEIAAQVAAASSRLPTLHWLRALGNRNALPHMSICTRVVMDCLRAAQDPLWDASLSSMTDLYPERLAQHLRQLEGRGLSREAVW